MRLLLRRGVFRRLLLHLEVLEVVAGEEEEVRQCQVRAQVLVQLVHQWQWDGVDRLVQWQWDEVVWGEDLVDLVHMVWVLEGHQDQWEGEGQ